MANNADIKFNVDNLELFYGNFKALKGIDMEIKKNEITALIGPSGCGKSTFLKTLNRMNAVSYTHLTLPTTERV